LPAAVGQQAAAAAAAARARAKQNLKGKRLGATYIGEKNRSGLRKGGAGGCLVGGRGDRLGGGEGEGARSGRGGAEAEWEMVRGGGKIGEGE
jgi:hypothetical protein